MNPSKAKKVISGITPLNKQIRMSREYNEWRKTIFERDDWTCQRCKQRGIKLCVDHYPKTFAQIFYTNNIQSLDDAMSCQEFWNINNGRTLCERCHRKTDTWGNKIRRIKMEEIENPLIADVL